MKETRYGRFCFSHIFSILQPTEHSSRPCRELRTDYKIMGFENEWANSWAPCINDYRKHRENRIETDNPKEDIKQAEFPEDGRCYWAYNKKNNNYDYKYTDGPGDRAWMEEKDHDYMRHIARFGTTEKKEQLKKEIRQLTTKDKDNKLKSESYARFFNEQRKLAEDERSKIEAE